jgi:hypothetical protein
MTPADLDALLAEASTYLHSDEHSGYVSVDGVGYVSVEFGFLESLCSALRELREDREVFSRQAFCTAPE